MRPEADSETWMSGMESLVFARPATRADDDSRIGAGGVPSTHPGACGLEPQEDLPVAARSGEPRLRLAGDGIAERDRRLAHRAHRLGAELGIAHDPALSDPLPPDLEVGLHEHEQLGLRSDLAQAREHEAHRDEGEVERRELDGAAEVLGLEAARVGALEHAHAGVAAQAWIELAVADVDRHHLARSG